MKKNTKNNSDVNSIRERIEEVLEKRKENKEITPKSASELLEEIHIFYQELEFQNEELHRISNDLEISKKHFFDLFEYAPVPYIICDEALFIYSANYKFRMLTGFNVNEIESVTKYILPEDQDTFYHFIKRVSANKQIEFCELQLKGKKITPVRLESNAIVLNGKMTLRIAFIDLSDFKHFEQRLLNTNKLLEQENLTRQQTEIQLIKNEEKLLNYSQALENELSEKKSKLKNAAKIQKRINDHQLPLFKNTAMQACYLPSEELGGDFFLVRHKNNKIIIILGDCEGHGIEAAMDSMLCRAVCDRHLDLLFENKPAQFLQTVNEDIIEYFQHEKFLTMFVCTYSDIDKTLNYANANAEIPCLIRNGEISFLDRPSGMHLGFSLNNEPAFFEEKSITLKENDILFLYSDAIPEITSGGNWIGREGIINIAKSLLSDNFSYIRAVLKSCGEYSPLPLEDDLTAIIFHTISDINENHIFYSVKQLEAYETQLNKLLIQCNYNSEIRCNITIAFREMYLNAISHGNKYDSSKKILVSLQLNCEQITLSIEDEGEGFCCDNVPDPTDLTRLKNLFENNDTEKFTHGRGVWLTRQYMDIVTYSKKGNSVCLIKKNVPSHTLFPEPLTKNDNVSNSYFKTLEGDPKEVYILWKNEIDISAILDSFSFGSVNQLKIVVDLQETKALDSLAIGKLLRLTKHCSEQYLLIFKINNVLMKEQMEQLGFEKLGVELQYYRVKSKLI